MSHLKALLCLLQFRLSRLLHKKQSDHDKTSINIFAAGCMTIVSDLGYLNVTHEWWSKYLIEDKGKENDQAKS
jgi:hypothetical protein